MPPIFEGFVHPALAFGAALASVPLLIHLLNRQRHKPMAWAAMRFVLAAYRKTRRRARLENLLLLLLRMAAIALLAFAVARPFTGAGSPLAGLTESRRDLVLVLDGSASTGYREDVRSVFQSIVVRARDIVHELDGARGDRVRLFLAGRHPRLLSWRSPEEALSILATLDEPTDEALDLAGTLGEVARTAEEEAQSAGQSGLEIRLLTDLQRRSFSPPPAPGEASAAAKPASSAPNTPSSTPASSANPAQHEPLLAEQLERLRALGLSVLVEDLGPRESVPANVGIASIEPVGEVLGPSTPTEFAVALENHGPSARSGLRVSLAVDGERRPVQPIDVPARGDARAVFSVTFKNPGEHVLEAAIDTDRLAVDDVRTQVVLVPPPVRVLLVDGAPAADIDQDAVGYIAAVLQPPLEGDQSGAPGSSPSPFEARVVEPQALRDGEPSLADFDVIVLANVESLADRTVERLEERVAAGAALIVSVGDRVDRESYDRRLFRSDGTGLLPAEIGARVAVRSRREDYFRVREFQQDHPALAFFADERWKPLLTELPIYEFLASRPLESARVLARLDDDASSPLFVERDYDRGKVFLWLTTLHPAWNRLAESPRTLVPLVHELLRYAATPNVPPRNVQVGGSLVAEVATFPRNVVLRRPDPLPERALSGDPEPSGAAWRLPAITDTDRRGLYRVDMDGGASVSFAVQIDPREGDLERLGANEIAALHPALRLVGSERDARGAADEDAPRQGELWRTIATACFVVLVLETLWAAWVGRSRRMR